MCGWGRTSTVAGKPGRKVFGPDVIEEDEGADHVPARVWQHATHFEPTQVAPALVDDLHGAIVNGVSPHFLEKGSGLSRPDPFFGEMGADPGRGWATQSDFRYSARSLCSPAVRPNEKCWL